MEIPLSEIDEVVLGFWGFFSMNFWEQSLLTGVVGAAVLGTNLQCIQKFAKKLKVASIEDYIARFCMGGPAAGLKFPRSTNSKPFEKLFKMRPL